MNRKKTLTLIFILLFSISATLVTQSHAVTVLLDETGLGEYAHGHLAGVNQSVAHIFTGNNQFLLTVGFRLQNATGFAGTIKFGVAQWNGSYSRWNDSQEFSTGTMTAADFDSNANSEWYYLDFAGTYNLTSDKTWAVYVVTTALTGGQLEVSYGLSSHSTYYCNDGDFRRETGASNQCYLTYIATGTGSEGSGGEGPGHYSGPDGPTNLIDDFVDFIVPLTVTMLPAVLLMIFTRRTDKWILLIGLAIGVGLGFYFGMVPIWLVFLVAIGLIGMAYQAVRGGGE